MTIEQVINLVTADTVIIFYSDLNSQNDLQEMTRARLVVQKNTGNIYRFVAKYTVEAKILGRSKHKIEIDYLII